MRNNVLTRKKANITLLLAKALKISAEQALNILYSSETNRLISERKCGLHLMSNLSLVRDILDEVSGQKGGLK